MCKRKSGWGFDFLLWLLTMLKFYLVGVGVTLSRRRRHTRFAYVSIPVDDPLLSRGEHRSPARYLKKLLFYRAFERPKARQKSFKRAFLPLKKHPPRARVSRASHAWQVRAANSKVKSDSFALPVASAMPRVRTYHTKKPSRFVHALSARPLKVQGGD